MITARLPRLSAASLFEASHILTIYQSSLSLAMLHDGLSRALEQAIVLNASNVRVARNILDVNSAIDMVLIDLTLETEEVLAFVAYLIIQHPHVSLIVSAQQATLYQQRGAIYSLSDMIHQEAMLGILESIELDRQQQPRLKLFDLLSLANFMGQSCVLSLSSTSGQEGSLYLHSGQLVKANHADAEQVAAVTAILTWSLQSLDVEPWLEPKGEPLAVSLEELYFRARLCSQSAETYDDCP